MKRLLTHPNLGRQGRLGNQLWQIASTIGIARKLRMQAVFPEAWRYREHFSIPDEFFGDTSKAESVLETGAVKHLDAERARPYLQDVWFWKNIASEIFDYFMPSVSAIEVIEQRFGSYGPVVGVHIRLGDNITEQGWKKQDIPPLPWSYYNEVLDVLSLERPVGTPVVVFSDSPELIRENLRGDYAVFEGGAPMPKEHEPSFETVVPTDWIDFFAFASCTYHIISNSSYAWWAAFISGDPTPIYPSMWYGPRLAQYCDPALMFVPLPFLKWRRFDVA